MNDQTTPNRRRKDGPLARSVWIAAQLLDTAQAIVMVTVYSLYEWLRGPT
jgi:hypothetical protein